MRPEDFSPGNSAAEAAMIDQDQMASMRPEDFSPGNPHGGPGGRLQAHAIRASMRPEDFSPGNSWRGRSGGRRGSRFNEAGGFLPRKPGKTAP